MAKPHAPAVTREDCIPITTGDFAEILNATHIAGLDGSGGKLNKHPYLRAVGAGCSVILPDDHNPGGILKRATIHGAVPCKQTVPRAEPFTILNLLKNLQHNDSSHC